MKQTIITAMLALGYIAGKGQIQYRIEGDIGKPDYTGEVHIIDLLTSDTVSKAQVKNGMLQPVEGKLTELRMCKIEAVDKSFQRYTLFIDEGMTHIEGCNDDGELRLSGTPVTDDLNSFNLAIKRNVEEQRNGTRSAEEADSISDKLISDIIIRHKDDVLGIKTLTGMAEVSLPPVLWLNLLEQMNPKFYSNRRLANYLSETKAKMEACARTWVGKQFIDFSVEYKGRNTRLSDYVGRGQYVLADFWASWCGPCKQQIPELTALFQQYKDRGLTILGIAVRDKEEKTERAISDLGIPYPQIINAQDIPASLYGIDAIPHTILFDPDGIIIARNIYGNELRAKLDEIFKDK